MTMPSSSTSLATPRVVQALRHRGDAVAFLHPQFLGSPQDRAALGTGGGNEQGREFIDGQGHLIHRESRCPAAARAAPGYPPPARRPPRARSSSVISAPIRRRILSTPVRVGLMPTWVSSRSEPGAILAATRKKAAEEMSAGTSIAQARSRTAPLEQADHAVVIAHRVAKSTQHPLGVIPGRRRLGHRGAPLGCTGRPAGQTGFDLGTGHGQVVVDTPKRLTAT